MSVNQMSVNQMSVNQMSVNQMSVNQMSVGQINFDQKTWYPNKGWQVQLLDTQGIKAIKNFSRLGKIGELVGDACLLGLPVLAYPSFFEVKLDGSLSSLKKDTLKNYSA